jgi:hypothetical protein
MHIPKLDGILLLNSVPKSLVLRGLFLMKYSITICLMTLNMGNIAGLNTKDLGTEFSSNAAISGPALRDAHSQVGWYLATEFCTQILGVETCNIAHVQGHQTDGYHVHPAVLAPRSLHRALVS